MQSNSSTTGNTSQESDQNNQNCPPKKKAFKIYTYQEEWERDERFSGWVKKSSKGDLYFYCKICKCHLRCATGGRNVLTRHNNSTKHLTESGQIIFVKNENQNTEEEMYSLQNNMVASGSMTQSCQNEISCTPSTSTLQMPLGRPSLPVPTTTYLPTDIVQQPTITATTNKNNFSDVIPRPCGDREHSEERDTNISSIDIGSTSSSNQTEDFLTLGKMKMACFLAKHNLRLDITEELKNLMQSVCSDSDIAKHLTFKETEAHSIITDIIGNIAEKALINTLIKEKFSLIVEDIYDQSTKQLVFTVRTAVDFKVEDHFLNLVSVEEPSSNTLHHHTPSIQEYFERNKIPYKENMIGLAAEATSSIFSTEILSNTLLPKDIPNLFLLKCTRNSFHMCASHACKVFPVEFKQFVIRMNTYIQNKQFKRPLNVEHFQSCLNEKPDIHFVSDITSIPFLLPMVQQMLEKLTDYSLQYAALYNTRVLSKSTIDQCSSPTITKLYLEFLRFILPCFDKANIEMQSEVPKVYKLYKHVIKLYKEILVCFIKPELFAQDKVEEEQDNKLLSLNYESSDNHLPLQRIYLGGNVATLLLQEEFIAKLDPNEVTAFKKICKHFYLECIKQIRKRFPFENKEMKRLKSLTFLDPEHLIKKDSVSSIADLGIHFEGICPSDMTELDREWRDLRNINLSDYDLTIKAEEFWKDVSAMKKDNMPMFPLLSQFVRSLLALPHSSATNQRIISSINMLAAPVQNRQTTTLHGFLHIQSLNNTFEPTEEHLNLFYKIFDN